MADTVGFLDNRHSLPFLLTNNEFRPGSGGSIWDGEID